MISHSTLRAHLVGDVMPMPLQKVEVHQGDKTIIKTKPRIERNRVLVTGGAGFVGSHLCTYLVERGDHVSILFLRPYPGVMPHMYHICMHGYPILG